MTLAVDIDIRDSQWPAFVREPEALVRATLMSAGAATGVGDGEVSVVLAGDEFVRRLNRDHRGIDAPTNVLSFLGGGTVTIAGVAPLLGDIVLARETVGREARSQGKTPADHLAHLVVHGFLHLLGHDHQDDDEARRMETLEVAILAGLGISDPYRAADPVRGSEAV